MLRLRPLAATLVAPAAQFFLRSSSDDGISGLHVRCAEAHGHRNGIAGNRSAVRLSPAEFIQRFQEGKRLREDQCLQGLAGRIMWGYTPGAFIWLGYDSADHKPFTTAVGSDALERMIGKSPLDVLMLAGIDLMSIHAWATRGVNYQLVVFPEDSLGRYQATWESLVDRVEASFDKECADIVREHLTAVRTVPFAQHEARYDAAYTSGALRAATSNENHKAHMSGDRLRSQGKNNRPADVRAFLLHELGLAETFTGEGTTGWGGSSVSEFSVRNIRLDDPAFEKAVSPLGGPQPQDIIERLCRECKMMEAVIDEAEPKIISDPKHYIERLCRGEVLAPNEEVRGLCGRICNGRLPRDFDWLKGPNSATPAFFCGPDGLSALLGKEPVDMLLECGFNELDIYSDVKHGSAYCLVVVPDDGNLNLKPATWDGALSFVELCFPDVLPIVKSNFEQVRSTSYEELDEDHFRRKHIHIGAVGWNEERFMTQERLKNLGAEARPSDVRAFFYHTMRMNHLFAGDGFTVTPSGARGFKEYFLPNMNREELEKHGAQYATIGTPDITTCAQKVCQRYAKLRGLRQRLILGESAGMREDEVIG